MPLNERGHEIPNPIPAAVPLQWRRPPTLQEQIKAFVRRELSDQAAAEGAESFEEADDFDVDDDYDPTSPWELHYDQETAGPPGAAGAGNPPVHAGSSQDAPATTAVPGVPPGQPGSGDPATSGGNPGGGAAGQAK